MEGEWLGEGRRNNEPEAPPAVTVHLPCVQMEVKVQSRGHPGRGPGSGSALRQVDSQWLLIEALEGGDVPCTRKHVDS
jgi:hypothetical protein